jgi:FkbM family methyltransferase
VIRHLLRPIVVKTIRMLPIKSGTTRISFNRFMDWLMANLPDPAMTTLTDGTPIAVSPSDFDGRVLYLFGTNDPKVAATTRTLLSEGDTFLDIGANHATIGFAASHCVGPTGHVHVFEPQKRLGDRIAGAIAAGRFTTMTLHRVGLLDVDGSFELSAPSDHTGMATFVTQDDASAFGARETCEVRSVSDYVAPLVAGRRFGVKIDIEGAEPRVMPWLLMQPGLRFIIFEAASNSAELYQMVCDAGFALYGLARHPVAMRYGLIETQADMGAYHDMVALNVPRAGAKLLGRAGLKALLGTAG